MDMQNNTPTDNPLEAAVRDLCGKVDKYLKQGCLRSELYHVNERVKALLNTLPKQKPAEWSEEDKKMIERLIRHTKEEFDELRNDRYGHQEIISDLKESCRERLHWLENRLKSLRPQPKEEWSEEDRKRLESVIHRTEVICGGNAYGELKKDIDWLNSLRPSWKPSEKQPVVPRDKKTPTP